jgi:hypothetical protein
VTEEKMKQLYCGACQVTDCIGDTAACLEINDFIALCEKAGVFKKKWISCAGEPDNTPLDLNIVHGLDVWEKTDGTKFFIQFRNKEGKPLKMDPWEFSSREERNKVYTKIYNMLSPDEL